MANTISVVLVEDDADSRVALRKLLGTATFNVAGEAGHGAEAVSLARELQPDAILVSLEEPVLRPLKTIEILMTAAPESPVVVLSSLGDKEYMRRAMLAGARDYVTWPCAGEDLQKAITNVVEAEQKRRSLAHDVLESGHRGEVIAVFSGKGGVGRTTIATNLAVAMALEADQKQRVALVDLDFFLGDAAIMLDVTPERTIADLVPVLDKLDSHLLRGFLHVHASGLKVLCAPTRPEDGESISADHVRRILDVLARTFDYVIVDLPRSLDDTVITTLDIANLVLLITNYDIPCLKSTKVCLSMLRSWRYSEEKLKLVINHANRGGGVNVGEADTVLDYPIFWKLPSEFTTVGSSNHGKPFVQLQPTAKISQNIVSLATTLSGGHKNGRSFLARLMGRT